MNEGGKGGGKEDSRRGVVGKDGEGKDGEGKGREGKDGEGKDGQALLNQNHSLV